MSPLVPHVIIAGISKAGTTSVFRYLSRHPDICPSNIKEVRFFAQFAKDLNGIRREDLKLYTRFFNDCSDSKKIRVEASPAYLYGGRELAAAISKWLPDVRLVFILRDPVQRFLSHFRYARTKSGTIPENYDVNKFIEAYLNDRSRFVSEIGSSYPIAWEAFEASLYGKHLSNYTAFFPKRQLYVCFFEELQNNTKSFMHDMCGFLSIEPLFYNNFNFTVENRTRYVRFKRLQKVVERITLHTETFLNRFPELRNRLRDIYYLFNPEVHSDCATLRTESREKLKVFFSQDIKLLRHILKSTKTSSWIPEWLNDQ